MKNTHRCPKCTGSKIWLVQRFEAKDPSVQTGGGYPLRVTCRSTPPTRPKSMWSGDGSESYDTGYVDAFICAACGYTEFWSHSFEQLVHHPASGVILIDDAGRA